MQSHSIIIIILNKSRVILFQINTTTLKYFYGHLNFKHHYPQFNLILD